jgi:hypothetical protein
MHTVVDDRLRSEVQRFRLRFTCEHCAHFDPELTECSQGYPADEHRDPRLEGRSELVFCKMFEAC